MSKSFLQSSDWELFQKQLKNKTYRVNEKLLIKNPLMLGQSYLYSPRVSFEDKKDFESFFDKVKDIANKEGAFFLRIEPDVESSDIKFADYGFNIAKEKQPKQTLMVDLSNSEEELLANMKQKTRYNIRLAQKKDVKIVKGDGKGLKAFCLLAEETAERDKIKFFPKEYYFELINKIKKAKIYTAYIGNKPLASAIFYFDEDIVYYLHGCSSSGDRQYMAPYLLQWEAMLDAKKTGARWYDFWGVAPLVMVEGKFEMKNPDHSWNGITKFKLGFAQNDKTAKYVVYPGCYEYSFGKKRYLLYSLFKKIR